MIFRTIIVIALAVFSVNLVTACAHDVASQAAEENTLKTEWNNKTAESDTIEHDLSKNHHVYIGAGHENDTFARVSWLGVSDAERALVKRQLKRYLEIVGRLIELADHKLLSQDVTTRTKLILRDDQASAQEHLKAIENYENKNFFKR